MKNLLCLMIFFVSAVQSYTQWESPEWGNVFLQNEVPEVHIQIGTEQLEQLLHPDSAFSNFEHSANFTFISSNGTETVQNVGFRLRGNTSRLAEKKSFKVSFNTFQQGLKWNGLEKLNLNGEHNDPSILRSRINWEMAYRAGLPFTRSGHVRLYINDEYYGLYLNVEHVDEEFVQNRYSYDARNFYKCGYGSSLEFLGNNPDSYKLAPWGSRVYELKNNQLSDDYSDLAHFVNVLNNSPQSEFACEIKQIFDVEKYLKTLAFEVLIGHWDGYAFNNNNYYLIHRTTDDKFEFLEYDLDNTLGIDWIGLDWSTRNIYNWQGDNRPLVDKLLDVNEFRDLYSYHLHTLSTEILPFDSISDRLQFLQEMISDAASEDIYRTLDYGFDVETFDASLTEAWGGHVDFGILDYLAVRYSTIQQQIEDFPVQNIIVANVPTPRIDGYLMLTATVLHSADLSSLFAEVSWDNGSENLFEMNDAGINGDQTASDGIWSVLVAADGDFASCHLTYITPEGTYDVPCSNTSAWTSQGSSPLLFNELSGANTSTISDEFNEFDDWLELYNTQPTGLQLNNYRITDNLDVPELFTPVNSVISGNAFRLIWCDGQNNQGSWHADFKIANSGEYLYLLQMQNGAWRVTDRIFSETLSPNTSLGRSEDGYPEWVVFEAPTPGASNHMLFVDNLDENQLLLYPNPTNNWVRANQFGDWIVYNAYGQIVDRAKNTDRVNLFDYPDGVYFIQLFDRIIRIVKE